MEGTKVYGASDDLVEIEGEYAGEVGSYDNESGVLLVMSDGTLLKVFYGDEGIWKITLIKKGQLLERIDQCDDADARPHSDVAYFGNGIKWVYAAKEWEKVS